MKRKTPFQLQSLENFYAEKQYPTHGEMESIAGNLGLTYKQVRRWFIEKRRRDKGLVRPEEVEGRIGKMGQEKRGLVGGKIRSFSDLCLESRLRGKRRVALVQNLLSPDYIVTKIFRKDGPSLGVEFDPVPLRIFRGSEDVGKSGPLQDHHIRNKRKKVSGDAIVDGQDENQNVPVKKHGIGKGLMKAWRVTNPNGGDFPTGVNFSSRQDAELPKSPTPISRMQCHQNKKRKQSFSITRKLANKVQDMKKPFIKRPAVKSVQPKIQKQPLREECELALEGLISQECLNQISLLMDDEELELRELQSEPNPPTCSEHCAAKGQYGCSLCKDLLPRFPPISVRMKQPFATQPWVSSPESVKKLFKVFHFLYTHSVPLDICHFTLDEFAQAFHDKESLLLGKVHLELLKFLFSDVESEINQGVSPPSGISCKFLALLHSVEDQDFVLEFWRKSLNPLTWTEILRQVLVAAGFESKHGALQREAFSKERRLMAQYGLHPRTLKGELFRLLTELGIKGSRISDLAKSSQIAELDLASTTEELENLIGSTLSSDISLFEKISSSAYRIRCNALAKEDSDFDSGSEDSGSVHDVLNENNSCSSSDSECDLENSNLKKLKLARRCKNRNNILTVAEEIDESHAGEEWLLGLMEGEYSDLSIEEKLCALVALIDLLSAGCSIRMEDSARYLVKSVFEPPYCGSGAKIKRSMPKQLSLPRPSWVYWEQLSGAKEGCRKSKSCPIDSSVLNLKQNAKNFGKDKDAKAGELGVSGHPMQSNFLGSDRRYNRYWLFLGPCDAYDPGHKRVYFESAEDGHWEVIDNAEALRALLSVLDDRGRREALLIESLEKREAFLVREMSNRTLCEIEFTNSMCLEQTESERVREDTSSPISDIDNNLNSMGIMEDPLLQCGAIVLEAGRKSEEEYQRWNRLQNLDAWIWEYFYRKLNAVKNSKKSYLDSLAKCQSCHDLYWRDEKHCKICHKTFELDFDLEERYAIHAATCRDRGEKSFPKHKVLPSQLQALKAAVYAIESAMPENALVGAWRKSAHRLWVKRLRRTSSLQELLQVVADFVYAINEDWLYQRNSDRGSNSFMDELIACFPSMPQTSSALAVWLVKLDELLSPCLPELLC